MQTIIVTNKDFEIIYDAIVDARRGLEREHYGKGFAPYDELVALEASLLSQCPKFAELHENVVDAINMHDVQGAKKACDVLEDWKNEDAKRKAEKEAIKFIDSTPFTDEENKLNIKAYYNDLDAKLGEGVLMQLSDAEIKSSIDRMLELGYTIEAVKFVMNIQKDCNEVILPHKVRYYQEFNCLKDMLVYYGYKTEKEFREYSALTYKKLSNGHVLVFKIPQEIENLINQWI